MALKGRKRRLDEQEYVVARKVRRELLRSSADAEQGGLAAGVSPGCAAPGEHQKEK